MEDSLQSQEQLNALKSDMLRLLPLINEANAIAQALAKPVSFRVDHWRCLPQVPKSRMP